MAWGFDSLSRHTFIKTRGVINMSKYLRLLFIFLVPLLVITCSSDDSGSAPVSDCTDATACNYNENATVDDGSCTYAAENYDCDGNCLPELADCAGVCAGDNSTYATCCGLAPNADCSDDCYTDTEETCCAQSEVDDCGICNGDGSSCATAFTFALSGSSSDFLNTSGSINQDSEEATKFKESLVAT